MSTKNANGQRGALAARGTKDKAVILPHQREQVKRVELALDALYESEYGDIGLVERNLVEAATELLNVAADIRGRLRQ